MTTEPELTPQKALSLTVEEVQQYLDRGIMLPSLPDCATRKQIAQNFVLFFDLIDTESEKQEDCFYTIKEAAEVLKIREATIREWIAQEILPAYRVGPKAIRIAREDLLGLRQPYKTRPQSKA